MTKAPPAVTMASSCLSYSLSILSYLSVAVSELLQSAPAAMFVVSISRFHNAEVTRQVTRASRRVDSPETNSATAWNDVSDVLRDSTRVGRPLLRRPRSVQRQRESALILVERVSP